MREEVISSGGTTNATPTASSAGASSPAAPANTRTVDCSSYGHVSKVLSLSYVCSQQPRTSLSTGSAVGSSRPSCRPWEREDLLRRLSTFKPSNWFRKPKVASSLSCAQRGWMNVDVDKIACEFCSAQLTFTLIPTWTATQVEDAGEAFAIKLDAGHRMTCPWRGNSCPESLVQFPPTPQSALIGGYKDRCDGLLQFQSLPIIAAAAIERMHVSHGAQLERFLSQPQNFTAGEVNIKTESEQGLESSRHAASCLYLRAQKLISLCGWEPRWLLNIQDCEEQSAQSARDGCSVGPSSTQGHIFQEPGPSKNGLSSTAKKDTKMNKALAVESRSESRSPLLDCGLCGATVRIWDFLTVPQPASLVPTNIDIPDTSKKMALTRGVSAASGINGWADDAEKEQIEDREEVATANVGKLFPYTNVDSNHGGSSYIQLGKAETFGNVRDASTGRDMLIGQPSGSEVGDRAASHESRGPSSRKRNFEKGGSSDERTDLRMRQADSIEGIVIDRDNDEVTDERQYSAGPSKRARDSDMFDTFCSPFAKDPSGAGPSYTKGFEVCGDGNIGCSYRQDNDQRLGGTSTRDSARASSVIAMDTICNGADDDSLDSVENFPGDVDDIHFPSSSLYGNLELNETSELNYSNQVQQSICLQPGAEVAPGEMGVSSTNDGEEVFNAEAAALQPRDGFSFGISGGSVGMCASHEAEIHGADVSAHRAGSYVGDVEPRVDDVENQGQTGESAPGPGLMDEVIPEELVRVDPHSDSQEMSQSIARADSGSKVAESVESGEKISQSNKIVQVNNAHPSISCDAIVHSGHATSRDVIGAAVSSPIVNTIYFGVDGATANGIGPPKGESDYEEAKEFDPIIHHNMFCPWVNGNVAAAGSSNYSSGTTADAIALCGWQLTLDALDALRSLGQFPSQIVQSESAASLYKDDQKSHGKKLLQHHSFSRSRGQH